VCACIEYTYELQRRRDAETRVSRRETRACATARESVLPVPVENRREGGGKTRPYDPYL